MKKPLSFLFIVFVLIFAVSCGSGKKDGSEPTDTDNDTADTENPDGDDANSGDTPDPGDSGNDSGDSENNDDADSGDSGNDDDTDSGDTEEPAETHELIGKYADNWGGSHIISNTAWFQPSSYGDTLFRITQFDNENDFIIAQNDAEKSWFPEKWSRFDYVIDGGKIYLCQIAFDKETEDDALAATDADRTDLTDKGCNGSPWSELTETVEESIGKDDERIAAWATGYENYKVGEGVTEEWQTPEKALGKAVGDSYDVVVLGDGGSIVLTFAKPITDGDGADFAVFENSFNEYFLELGTVEVSSDGEHFAAFDNYYLGTEKIGSTGSHDARLIWGFAGKFKQGEGTMFDLAELADKPEVADGTVNLKAITHVKIADVIGDGSQKDSIGNTIYDPYPTGEISAGFDLDAVAVINEVKEPLEISGKWYAYQFGQYDTISNKGWSQLNMTYGGNYNYEVFYKIVKYDNENDTFIAYKEDTKYSKVNYALTKDGGKEILYLCEIAFNKETAEDAEAADDADKTDLSGNTCGGFSWNIYIRAGTESNDAKYDLHAEREKAANADDDCIDVWASGYDSFKPGSDADTGTNDPKAAEGKADGKFVSLGKGGSIVVTFTDPLPIDGGETGEVGTDFIIFANSADSHALAKVEVSSDGENFVAFDTHFLGMKAGGFDETQIFGFAGKFGNDKGTKFDLQDLSLKPEVKNGKVDLSAVTIVRITDIPGDGSELDSHGNPIFYPYPEGGFELDAAAAVK
ncbi:hypothetical protein J6Z19_03425 [bacterium]|nr:hypothetical protein [bacterium]